MVLTDTRQSKFCEDIRKDLPADVKVYIISQNQFYREDVPVEQDDTLPNYDTPGEKAQP